MVSERSRLPAKITGPGGGAFGLITDKLKAKAQDKAFQLAGHVYPPFWQSPLIMRSRVFFLTGWPLST